MKKVLRILGFESLGREAYSIAESMQHYDRIVFYDDNELLVDQSFRKGSMAGSFFDSYSKKDGLFCIAIGSPNIRNKIMHIAGHNRLATLIHSSSVVDPSSSVGVGSIIGPLCHIGPKVKIGCGVLVWSGTIISHDSYIGDLCYISPGVSIGGYTNIGAQTLIGLDASIISHCVIGEKCVVGMRGNVRRDVPSMTLVRPTGVHEKIRGEVHEKIFFKTNIG